MQMPDAPLHSSRQRRALNVSTYRVRFSMTRQKLGFVLRTFIPAILLVLVSWISFMVEPAILGPRTLAMHTLAVSEVNLLNAIKAPTHETTAIEIYVIVCLIFVILNIFEYVTILMKSSPIAVLRRKRKEKIRKKYRDPLEEEQSEEEERTAFLMEVSDIQCMYRKHPGHYFRAIRMLEQRKLSAKATASMKREKPLKKPLERTAKGSFHGRRVTIREDSYLDVITISILPSCFFLFNVMYWCYYIYG